MLEIEPSIFDSLQYIPMIGMCAIIGILLLMVPIGTSMQAAGILRNRWLQRCTITFSPATGIKTMNVEIPDFIAEKSHDVIKAWLIENNIISSWKSMRINSIRISKGDNLEKSTDEKICQACPKGIEKDYNKAVHPG